MVYDICIVGNGIIGSMAALEISKTFPKKKILFFNPEKPGGASKAAGAMLNVFGEIDYGKQFDDYQERKILLGIEAQKEWKLFISQNKKFKKIKTANDTIIFCKKNSTELEKNCFSEIKRFSNLFKRSVSNKNLKIKKIKKNLPLNSDFSLIKNEGAIDTKLYFKICNKILKRKKNIFIINEEVNKILLKNNIYEIILNKKKIKVRKLIISCGAYSKKLLGNISHGIQETYYGIGTALEIKSKQLLNIIPAKTVLRTPNRGSTCGIHLVPRNNGEFYLGAGSNISASPSLNPRIGTVEYLLTSLKNEISKDFDKDTMKTVIGFRPMSFDGRPLIGNINKHKNIFFISGTKRDGLTYAPIIVKSILGWVDEDLTYLEKHFYGWEPERSPISYGDTDFAIEAYVSNKLAGLIEHDLVRKKIKTLKEELIKEAYKMHKIKIKKYGLKSKFGIHPEVINVR
jgi:glycine oxidase